MSTQLPSDERREKHQNDKIVLNMDDDETADHVEGEVAAMAVQQGAKIIKGTDHEVDYHPLIANKRHRERQMKRKKVAAAQEKLGEQAPTVRMNSLLLAHGSFEMEAASRDDGADEEMMDTDSLIQVAQGPDSLADAVGDYEYTHGHLIIPGSTSLSDAPKLVLDSSEASMVASAADENIKRTHFKLQAEANRNDLGEFNGEQLPRMPMRGKVQGVGKECRDEAYTYICGHWKKMGKCSLSETVKQCAKTCGHCGDRIDDKEGSGHFAAPAPKNPGDCVVKPYSWSSCSSTTDGTMTGTRGIQTQPSATGMPCPKLSTTVKCNTGKCHQTCKTCSGATKADCKTCYSTRDDALNAVKQTAFGSRSVTAAWDPERRFKILTGEAAYQFKALDYAKGTGECIWEEDIHMTEYATVDGESKCNMGCDPPILMGERTPGFACVKKCRKDTWGFETKPTLRELNSKLVFVGKASRPTCIASKAISCQPASSTETFTGDGKMKCTSRKMGRCAHVRAGTYKMHKGAKVLGEAKLKLLLAEYSSEVHGTCVYDTGIDDYKHCQRGDASMGGNPAEAMKTGSDKQFVETIVQRAYTEGWKPISLVDGTWYFVKFQLDMQDVAEYACADNALCRGITATE